MSEQPEALRLARILRDSAETINGVAFELENMHALCEEMGGALEELSAEEWRDDFDPVLDKARTRARAALAKWKESK